MRVTLHHPELGETVEVDESQVAVLAKSGWEPLDDSYVPRGIAHSDKSADVVSGRYGAGRGDEEDLDR